MGLLDSIFDKEQMTFDTIQEALISISKELGCKHSEFFVMIKANNEKFEPKFYIYQLQQGAGPKMIREITIKEILGNDEDEENG